MARRQEYPRIVEGKRKEIDLLDVTTLTPHSKKIAQEQMEQIILAAIEKANQKSRRESMSIPENATDEEKQKIYRKTGKELFGYFKKYFDDPASTAQQIYQKHYRTVGVEQFRNRLLQKGRMNSGWRYQFLVQDVAIRSGRFRHVSNNFITEEDPDIELRLSDFVWPFYTNCSYEEIIQMVLEVLDKQQKVVEMPSEVEIPNEVLEAFGVECRKAGLVNEEGYFQDPAKLVRFFCKS